MRLISLMILLSMLITACDTGSESTIDNRTSNSANGNSFGLLGGFPALEAPPNNNLAMTSCSKPVPVPSNSTIKGVVQYERIPIGLYGLDYNARINLPARGVVVEAVDASLGQCSETVVSTGLTNAQGQYGLIVPVNQSVCVQVRAQLYRNGNSNGGSWDIQVTDNTSDNAAYYLVDNAMATPADNGERNFLAASGAPIGSSDYTQVRAAAPFAILDTLCESIESLVAADQNVTLPTLQVHWSVDNVASAGDISEGEIGGAFFRKQRSVDQFNNTLSVSNEIFLLGDEDNNTDEYDVHVISHEFAHFVINNLSRTDAFGGTHALGDRLDMRVAFDEGLADALSGIVLDDSLSSTLVSPDFYRDTLGINQGLAFGFNLHDNTLNFGSGANRPIGWYSESTVFSVIYNLFDSSNNTVDRLSLGFSPIYDVLTSSAYKDTEALITIFSFINQLKQNSSNDFEIDTLLAEENFETITDDFGSGENIANNDIASISDVEFIYSPLLLNTPKTVCSNDQFGVDNKLSVRQYLTFEAGVDRIYKFSIVPTTGAFSGGQILFEIFNKGLLVLNKRTENTMKELKVEQLLSGRYVLSLAAIANLGNDAVGVGRRCFSILVE